MVTMEAQMAQKLSGIVHGPLLKVLIDVRKAYNSLNRGNCMEILRGYDIGPNIQRLIHQYWDGQKVVLKDRKCFGRPF